MTTKVRIREKLDGKIVYESEVTLAKFKRNLKIDRERVLNDLKLKGFSYLIIAGRKHYLYAELIQEKEGKNGKPRIKM